MKLKINNLAIGYDAVLLENINAELNAGDIAILYGKNGSGKTTLVKTILKEIQKKNGTILLNNNELENISYTELSKLIAVVFSNNELQHSISVYDLVALGRFPYKLWYEKLNKSDIELIENALEITKLSKVKNQKFESLSDGFKQITMIARALAQDTPIIILDEPFSHLDVENQLNIMQILRKLALEKNKIILFTSHEWNLSFSLATQLIYIQNQQVFTGFLEDVLIENNFLSQSNTMQYHFDFTNNKFVYDSNNQLNMEVSILQNNFSSEKLYWLKNALEKYKISYIKKSELLIDYKDNKYILQINNVENQYNTIQQLIEKILQYNTK